MRDIYPKTSTKKKKKRKPKISANGRSKKQVRLTRCSVIDSAERQRDKKSEIERRTERQRDSRGRRQEKYEGLEKMTEERT